MDRMTDEEIRDIERALWGSEGAMVNHARKLLQALKVERECIRATAAEALLDEIAKEHHRWKTESIPFLEQHDRTERIGGIRFAYNSLGRILAQREQTDE